LPYNKSISSFISRAADQSSNKQVYKEQQKKAAAKALLLFKNQRQTVCGLRDFERF